MSKTYSCILVGLEVVTVEIETAIGAGFSGLAILGLKADHTRDMRERIRAALEHAGIPIPAKRVTVNISVPEMFKLSRTPIAELDFAVAASVVKALFLDQGIKLPKRGLEYMAGELSLSGSIKPVSNQLIYERMILELKVSDSVCLCLKSNDFSEACLLINHSSIHLWIQNRRKTIEEIKEINSPKNKSKSDINLIENKKIKENKISLIFSTIKNLRKNAKACVSVLVAVLGRHHILLAGEPGIGKSHTIKKMIHFLDEPTLEEKIGIKMIYAGKNEPTGRPFRFPHHSSSAAALIGGQSLKPGEVTLAHKGILFLDEIAEFSRQSLEALREPMDSRRVELSKAMGSVSYPADFLLCATTNPCPCGYFLSFTKPCRCAPKDSKRYMNKISGPLLDRFCIQLWMSKDDEDKDIFSNYLENLSDIEIQNFSEKYLELLYEQKRHLSQEDDLEYNLFNSQDSFRTQKKIVNLASTFKLLFSHFEDHKDFVSNVLKYRNFSKIVSSEIV